MKKKILFIISNMESGGVSKSMSSLLNVVDTDRFDVDCFILSPQGIFLTSIPTQVNLITDERTALFFSKFPQNVLPLFKKGWIPDAFLRVMAGVLMLINKGWGGWLLSRRIHRIKKHYDLAVDYNGQHQLYYLIDFIKAEKKVSFFHSDYRKWPYYYSIDKLYMPKADRVYTISEHCVQSLIQYFPDCSTRIGLFENISSAALIHQFADENVPNLLAFDGFKLISVGHLSKNKGTDLAIAAASRLKSLNLSFRWYFIGATHDLEWVEKLIEQYGVTNEIILLGLKQNPYPYIRQADLLVHTSLFEGKSIALDEAKILCKPIVVTNFSTVYDQFTDRSNASICEMNSEDIADKILELVQDPILRSKYINTLHDSVTDNSNEIKKLYALLD